MNFMKKVKSLGLSVLTASMVLSSGVAFAADKLEAPTIDEGDKQDIETAGEQAVTATGEQAEITIKVNLPTSFSYILNPYEIDEADQVLSPVSTIENLGNTAIKVSLVKATATIEGNKDSLATLATAPITSSSTKKEAFLWVNISTTTEDPSAEYNSSTDSSKVVNDGTKTTKSLEIATLPASPDDGTTAGGSIKYKLDGSLNGKASWTAEDKIIVTPTFSFTPTVDTTVSTTPAS
jgi:hypothetical protein